MNSRIRTLVLGAVLPCPVSAALALEFKSANEPAILFDSPSDKGAKLFVIRPETPVEAVLRLDNYVKVREPGGTIAWIEAKALSNQRTLLVTANVTAVYRQADENAPKLFELGRDVAVNFKANAAAGWVEIQHKEGGSGFVRARDVWGL